MLELDEVVRQNQLACLPIAKSGRAEDDLIEKYPRLPELMERSKLIKIDSVSLQTRLMSVKQSHPGVPKPKRPSSKILSSHLLCQSLDRGRLGIAPASLRALLCGPKVLTQTSCLRWKKMADLKQRWLTEMRPIVVPNSVLRSLCYHLRKWLRMLNPGMGEHNFPKPMIPSQPQPVHRPIGVNSSLVNLLVTQTASNHGPLPQ